MSELWLIPIALGVMGLIAWAEWAWSDYQLRQAMRAKPQLAPRRNNDWDGKMHADIILAPLRRLQRPRMREDSDGMWRCWSPGWTTWEHAEIAQRACSAKIAYLNWRSYYLERNVS